MGGLYSWSILPQKASSCFWPGEVGEAVVYGKLKVKLEQVKDHEDILLRRMEITEDKSDFSLSKPLKVVLLQLTSWPEQGLPHPSAILFLVDHLSKSQMSTSTKHTVFMCRCGSVYAVLCLSAVHSTVFSSLSFPLSLSYHERVVAVVKPQLSIYRPVKF